MKSGRCATELSGYDRPLPSPCSTMVGTVMRGLAARRCSIASRRGIARGVAEAVAIGLDHDVDEVGIVERGRGALIGRVIEPPVRRPQSPQQLAELAAIGRQPGTAALGVEIVLIPKPVLQLRRHRLGRSGNILNVVAVGRHQAAHLVRPQRGDDAGGAPAPIVAGQHGARHAERIDEFLEVVAERRLLARARRFRGEETGRTVAAQIGHDRAASALRPATEPPGRRCGGRTGIRA